LTVCGQAGAPYCISAYTAVHNIQQLPAYFHECQQLSNNKHIFASSVNTAFLLRDVLGYPTGASPTHTSQRLGKFDQMSQNGTSQTRPKGKLWEI
jgi:hypothetical protein